MKKKVNFLYFADENGNNQTNVAYAPGYYWGDGIFEDLIIKCEILNGEVLVTPVIESWMGKDEIKELKREFKNFKIKDSWEFFEFSPTQDLKNQTLQLYSDKNSKMFNVINSPKNLKNLKSMEDKLKDELDM